MTTYSTGNVLVDGLTEFCAKRLDAPPVPRVPCLAEDWWVEDRLGEGLRFPRANLSAEEGLRFCWRLARKNNVEQVFAVGRFDREPADLLLHQMTQLLPTMLAAAERQYETAPN